MDYVEHDIKNLMDMMKKRGKKFTIPQVLVLMPILFIKLIFVFHFRLKHWCFTCLVGSSFCMKNLSFTEISNLLICYFQTMESLRYANTKH